ncbi:MAG TPA: site-2 protease family protein [Blastocatellia bacterium]|jgi:Zn-dependent protease/CBS domain-containing protein
MTINLKPIYLGRIFGIPVRAHYSWLPVFPFYAWAISTGLLPREAPGHAVWHYWALGFLTTALLFASVIIHELAHALMARTVGVGTKDITLYMFGGLATLEGQPADPTAEFKIAVVGPAASFLLGTVFFASNELFLHGTPYRAAGQVLRHLGIVNWFLAGFNILPGLPLDGGRVLRALLWKINKNYRAATQSAIRFGLMIAIALVSVGIYWFLFKEWVTGMWCMIVGLMIALMLGTTESHTRRALRVKRGTVEDVMHRDVVLVPPAMKIIDFIDKVLKSNHQTSFPVASERRLHGMLMLEELKRRPREDWPRLETRDVMRPVDTSMFIPSSTPLAQARSVLSSNKLGHAVVIDSNGFIIGQVSLADVEVKR